MSDTHTPNAYDPAFAQGAVADYPRHRRYTRKSHVDDTGKVVFHEKGDPDCLPAVDDNGDIGFQPYDRGGPTANIGRTLDHSLKLHGSLYRKGPMRSLLPAMDKFWKAHKGAGAENVNNLLVYLKGAPAVGKTSLGYVFAESLGTEVRRINCQGAHFDDLIWEPTIEDPKAPELQRQLIEKYNKGGAFSNPLTRNALKAAFADAIEQTGGKDHIDPAKVPSDKAEDVSGRVIRILEMEGMFSKGSLANVKYVEGPLLRALKEAQTKPMVILLDEYSRRLDAEGGSTHMWELLSGAASQRHWRTEKNGHSAEIDNKLLADHGSIVMLASNPARGSDQHVLKEDPGFFSSRAGLQSIFEVPAITPGDYMDFIQRELIGGTASIHLAADAEKYLVKTGEDDEGKPLYGAVNGEGQRYLQEKRYEGLTPEERKAYDTMYPHLAIYNQTDVLPEVMDASARLGKFVYTLSQLQNPESSFYDEILKDGSDYSPTVKQLAEKAREELRGGNNDFAEKVRQAPFDLRYVYKLLKEAQDVNLIMPLPADQKKAYAASLNEPVGHMTEKLGTRLVYLLKSHINQLSPLDARRQKSAFRQLVEEQMLEQGIARTGEIGWSRTKETKSIGDLLGSGDAVGTDISALEDKNKAIPKTVSEQLNRKPQRQMIEDINDYCEFLFQEAIKKNPKIGSDEWEARYEGETLKDQEIATYYRKQPHGAWEKLSHADALTTITTVIKPQAVNEVLQDKLPAALRKGIVLGEDVAKENDGQGGALNAIATIDVDEHNQLVVREDAVVGVRAMDDKNIGDANTFTVLEAEVAAHRSNPGPDLQRLLISLAVPAKPGEEAKTSMDMVSTLVTKDFTAWLKENRDIKDIGFVEGTSASGLALTTLRVGSYKDKNGKEAPSYLTVVMQKNTDPTKSKVLLVGDENIDARLISHLVKNSGITYVNRHAAPASAVMDKIGRSLDEMIAAGKEQALVKVEETAKAKLEADKDYQALGEPEKATRLTAEIAAQKAAVEGTNFRDTLTRALRHRVGPNKEKAEESGGTIVDKKPEAGGTAHSYTLDELLANKNNVANPVIPEIMVELSREDFKALETSPLGKLLKERTIDTGFSLSA